MRSGVFRLIFVRDIHYRFTIGVGNVCLLFEFLCDVWPYYHTVWNRTVNGDRITRERTDEVIGGIQNGTVRYGTSLRSFPS